MRNMILPYIIIMLFQVGAVKTGVCNYLYGRDVKATGKFCAGGVVDACQVRGWGWW